MPTHDDGLRPETVSDHYMAAAVEELRAAVKILGEIKDVMLSSLQAKPLDLSTHDSIHVKEHTAKRKN